MKFYTWEQRLDFLDELKDAVTREFPNTDSYNIFIFGSFIRDDYDPENSDLDLAIYASIAEQTFAICDFIDQFLKSRNVPCSLLEIFTDQLDAYVVIKPLGLNIGFTDYFPEDLKIYFRTVQRRAIFYDEESKHVERVRLAMLHGGQMNKREG